MVGQVRVCKRESLPMVKFNICVYLKNFKKKIVGILALYGKSYFITQCNQPPLLKIQSTVHKYEIYHPSSLYLLQYLAQPATSMKV